MCCCCFSLQSKRIFISCLSEDLLDWFKTTAQKWTKIFPYGVVLGGSSGRVCDNDTTLSPRRNILPMYLSLCVAAPPFLFVSLHISFTFSSTMLQCRSKAFTLASSLWLFLKLMRTWVFLVTLFINMDEALAVILFFLLIVLVNNHGRHVEIGAWVLSFLQRLRRRVNYVEMDENSILSKEKKFVFISLLIHQSSHHQLLLFLRRRIEDKINYY